MIIFLGLTQKVHLNNFEKFFNGFSNEGLQI